MTIIHERFDIFHPRSDSLVYARTEIPDNEGQAFGLALDDSLKTLANRKGYRPAGPYDPFDLQMGNLLVEIKSTAKNSFTFSEQEYNLIKDRIANDQQYICLFYFNCLANESSMFLGQLNLDHLSKMKFIDSKTLGQVYLSLEEVNAVLTKKYQSSST